MASWFEKTPGAVLDYKFDWSDWLATGETISSMTVTADTGITIDSSAITDSSTSVTVWLSAGSVDMTYEVTCKIVTSAGRTDERTISIALVPTKPTAPTK